MAGYWMAAATILVLAYTGTHVEPERRGLPWASRGPEGVYACVEDYL